MLLLEEGKDGTNRKTLWLTQPERKTDTTPSTLAQRNRRKLWHGSQVLAKSRVQRRQQSMQGLSRQPSQLPLRDFVLKKTGTLSNNSTAPARLRAPLLGVHHRPKKRLLAFPLEHDLPRGA